MAQGTRKAEVVEGTTTAPTTIALYLRSSPSAVTERRQRGIVERLDALAERDDVGEFSIERWSECVSVPPVEDGGADAAAVELYEELRHAVTDAGGRLHPFFQRRESVDGFLSRSGDAEYGVVFPVACLTVRRNGRLTGMYPCWLDGEHHSVEAALDRIQAGRDFENLWSGGE